MNIFEAILTRRSWRTYNGLRLDENTISQVESIISAANAAASEPLTRDAAVPAPRVVLLETNRSTDYPAPTEPSGEPVTSWHSYQHRQREHRSMPAR